MVSVVKVRTHYEVLGIKPSATRDEIAQAFARETSMFRPRPFGGLAEVTLAYEVLHDPGRRRAYDASIGIKPPPAALPTIRASLPTAPLVSPQPLIGRSAVPFVAAPARPPLSENREAPEPEPRLRPGPEIGRLPPLPMEDRLNVEVSPIEWKRMGMMVGGLAGAAILIGALAGWWSGREANLPPQPEAAKAKPAPNPVAATEAPQFGAVRSRVDAPPDRRRLAAVAPVPAERTVAGRQPAAPVAAAAESEPQEGAVQPGELVSSAGEEAASPAPAAVAAAMPLPNRVIARTIGRIGYTCGEVASAAPVEGEAAGVYKITCTSGHSYQAKPVNGRYHFRRWGRN